MRFFAAAILSFVFVLAPLVTLAQDAEEPAATIEARNGDTISDAEIDKRIEEILREIDGLQSIFVSVNSGVVTLRGEVTESALADQALGIAGRVNGVVTVKNEIQEVTSLNERLVPVWQRLNNRFWETMAFLPLFLVALVAGGMVFTAGLLVAARSWPWDRISPNTFIADLLRQIIRLAFFLAGVVLALDILGATALLGTILGAAGIVGLAIGFAVRDTVENYIASILLSIRQPFRPKDLIAIESYEGFVISLTSRATILMDISGNHIRIPNSTVFKSNITNYSRNPNRRFDFSIGVGSESNLDKALDVGLDVIMAQSFILPDPAPDAWIEAIGDSNIEIKFSAWVDQTRTSFVKARSEAMRLTKLALESNGFALPEPIFRIIHQQGAVIAEPAKIAPSTPQKVKPASAKPREDTRANDTAADESIIHKVDEERINAGKQDLLRDDAPDELGDQPSKTV